MKKVESEVLWVVRYVHAVTEELQDREHVQFDGRLTLRRVHDRVCGGREKEEEKQKRRGNRESETEKSRRRGKYQG